MKKKPTKKQKAKIALLDIVDTEGLHYGLVQYGGDKEVKEIDDPELTELFNSFRETSRKLEEKLSELAEDVKDFWEPQ